MGKGKSAGTVTFEKATIADLKAATRALAASPARGTSKAAAAFAKAFGATTALAEVRVTERDGKVSFLRVPLASVGRFAAAVGRTKLSG